MAPHARVRGRPAGREDAGHGRVRDGRAHPAARPLAPHADHLPHRRGPDPGAGRPGVRGRRGGLPGEAGRPGVRPLEGGRLRRARQEVRAAPAPGRAAPGERAGRARSGRDPRRAGAGPGAQEPGARELQLRGVPRPPGAAPPDRELQPRGAGEPGRASGRRRPPLSRPRARGQPADVGADRRRALSGPGHPCRDAASRKWT